MKTNSRYSHGMRKEPYAAEPKRPIDAELFRVIQDLEKEFRPWTSQAVSHTIWLLSTIANDQDICVQNPRRVVDAFRSYGHLLCHHEVEMLNNWLVEQNRSPDSSPEQPSSWFSDGGRPH